MKALKRHITAPTSIAPLAIFRVLFGFIMLVSTVRFALKGWIHELYLRPDFFFSYYGFEWVQPLVSPAMYVLFAVIGLSALCIMLGWHYRWVTVIFFLGFTYVELLDKTHYLNHYYFVSIIAFLLIWVPAHRRFSLDVRRKPGLRRDTVPAWMVNIFKLQVGIVYFYAGLAKLNPDWLLKAMPMKIWLPTHEHWPLIGPLLDEPITARIFSWAGAAFDLSITFFLLNKSTRKMAYLAVVGFHLFTYALFQIGMFPFIMILSTLIFFSPRFHEQCISQIQRLGAWFVKLSSFLAPKTSRRAEGNPAPSRPSEKGMYTMSGWAGRIIGTIVILHMMLQLLLPLRFLVYPGNVLWTGQGYRFSWRVMLVEKTGHTVFHVQDKDTGREWQAANWRYLTPRQEKMMAINPDMMLEYAHYLEKVYRRMGKGDVRITVDSFVTLNGRSNEPLVDSTVDLTELERGLHAKSWILPLDNNHDNRY